MSKFCCVACTYDTQYETIYRTEKSTERKWRDACKKHFEPAMEMLTKTIAPDLLEFLKKPPPTEHDEEKSPSVAPPNLSFEKLSFPQMTYLSRFIPKDAVANAVHEFLEKGDVSTQFAALVESDATLLFYGMPWLISVLCGSSLFCCAFSPCTQSTLSSFQTVHQCAPWQWFS